MSVNITSNKIQNGLPCPTLIGEDGPSHTATWYALPGWCPLEADHSLKRNWETEEVWIGSGRWGWREGLGGERRVTIIGI